MAPIGSANNQLMSSVTPASTGHDGCFGVGWSSKNGDIFVVGSVFIEKFVDG
jgi:hypothetical protein